MEQTLFVSSPVFPRKLNISGSKEANKRMMGGGALEALYHESN